MMVAAAALLVALLAVAGGRSSGRGDGETETAGSVRQPTITFIGNGILIPPDSMAMSDGGAGSSAPSDDSTPAVDGAADPTTAGDPTPVDDDEWVLVGHATVAQVIARTEPDPSAPVVAELANPTEVGGPLVFQLVGNQIDASSGWVEVRLPVRPNGTTGWVPLAELELTRNPYRIEINASDHHLTVLESGDVWLSAMVAIGTGSTPTPRGQFYIIELLEPPNPDGSYGPYAFGLSGFSESLTSFAGGDGVIGIHGTNDPGALGTDVSHGCVRVENSVMTTMAAVVPLGTPVEIVG